MAWAPPMRYTSSTPAMAAAASVTSGRVPVVRSGGTHSTTSGTPATRAGTAVMQHGGRVDGPAAGHVAAGPVDGHRPELGRRMPSRSNTAGGWTGVTVNQHLGPKHQEKVDRLEKASHHQFDRVYLDIVRENLASVVPYFEKEGRAAKSAQVRDLVEQELPMIQQHLDRAKTLEQQAQASAKAQPKDRSLSSKE